MIQEGEEKVEEEKGKRRQEQSEGQSVNNKVESCLWVALQPHLVDELRVVVAHAVQGGVPEGASQPRVPAQRGAAVGRE